VSHAGCQNDKILPVLEGCPNFRQVEGIPVFGVAIPTVQGLRVVLDKMRTSFPMETTLHWSHLREEPLVYINGRPFVVREMSNPFQNLEYTGLVPKCLNDVWQDMRAADTAMRKIIIFYQNNRAA
jgi:hypothetical protein